MSEVWGMCRLLFLYLFEIWGFLVDGDTAGSMFAQSSRFGAQFGGSEESERLGKDRAFRPMASRRIYPLDFTIGL